MMNMKFFGIKWSLQSVIDDCVHTVYSKLSGSATDNLKIQLNKL